MKFGITSYDGNFPAEKLLLFQRLLGKYWGRWVKNPSIWKSFADNKEYASVEYGFDDVHRYNEFQQEFLRLTTDVKEIRSDQWYRKLWRRIKLNLGIVK